MDYYVIITDLGAELLAKATIEKEPIVLTEIAIGDGGGIDYDPTPSQLSLTNEVYRGTLNYLRVDPNKKSRFDAQVIIPVTTGGYVVREAGLFDSSGNMIAIAKVPPTYKPDPISGASSQLYYEIILDYISDANVIINITPSDLFITKEILNAEISELKTAIDIAIGTKPAMPTNETWRRLNIKVEIVASVLGTCSIARPMAGSPEVIHNCTPERCAGMVGGSFSLYPPTEVITYTTPPGGTWAVFHKDFVGVKAGDTAVSLNADINAFCWRIA